MSQTFSDLGEIGSAGGPEPSGLSPLDLPLLRDGATWDLTGYSNEAIDVWDLRTRVAIASPGAVQIQTPLADGIVRWTPNYANLPSGVYEARIRISPDGGTTFEGSGIFRFAIGAGSQ